MSEAPLPDMLLSTPIGEMQGRILYTRCSGCPRSVEYPLHLMAGSLGPDKVLRDILPRLRCKDCHGKPAMATLYESNLRDGLGRPSGWKVPLFQA